ncbi:MAG: IgGFc-binding protein [Paludibacteraceae bacterium]|nr:IgGFc-binding protein [Paludibacteraceae bacterium]
MLRRLSYIVCLFLLLVTAPLRAQWWNTSGDSWVNTDYNTTEGKEFWATFMRNSGGDETDASSMTLYLYASARANAIVTVENPNTSYIDTFHVAAGKQRTFKVPNDQAYIQLPNVASNMGLRITSTTPISLYCTNHHRSGKYDASNILPAKSLEREYAIQTYLVDQYATEFAIVSTANQYITISVQETVLNKEDFDYGDIKVDTVIKTDTTVYLRRGQSYLVRSRYITGSLAGTALCASRPIAIFQGGQSAKITRDPENHIFHQSYSTDQLGKEFVVVPTHNAVWDITRLTAFEDGTTIYRNGTKLVDLNKLETYQDTIRSSVTVHKAKPPQFTQEPNVVVYTTNKDIACFLYGTGYTNNLNVSNPDGIDYTDYVLGAPVMTPIIPQEYGVKSNIFATFNQSTNRITNYVNIVTLHTEVNGMRLDGVNISNDFKRITGTDYSYVIKEVSADAHKVENVGGRVTSTFTARVYGLGMSSSARESYAYSAGSRIERSIDMLIDGQYIKEKNVCIPNGTTFTPIINHDYDNYHWEFKPDNYSSYPIISDDYTSIQNYTTHLPTAGTWTASLVVNYTTPLCQNAIRDTVIAYIHMHDTVRIDQGYNEQQRRDICYGENFFVHYNGRQRYDYIADTTTTQQVLGKNIKFEINKEYIFKDTIPNEWGCDSVVWQHVTIRPSYDIEAFDTICYQHLPYRWINKKTGALIKTFTKDDLYNKHNLHLTAEDAFLVDSIITPKQKLQTRYGCDSLVVLKLLVMPDYELDDGNDDVCQDNEQGYIWRSDTDPKHAHTDADGNVLTGHNKVWITNKATNRKVHVLPGQKIPLNTPGTFTLVDSLKTSHVCQTCGDAGGCDSVHTKTIVVHKKTQVSLPELNLCDNDTVTALNDTLCVGYKYQGTIPEPWKSANRYVILNGDKTFTDYNKTHDALQCDSITTQRVHLCPTFETTLPEVSLCQNETKYEWKRADNGQLIQAIDIPTSDHYPVSFQYTDTLQANAHCGCDSILHLTLTVNPVHDTILYDTICDSSLPYRWTVHNNYTNKNQTFNILRPAAEAQNVWHTTRQANLQTFKGCDSIVHLDLIVYPKVTNEVTLTLCPEQLPYQYCENGATMPVGATTWNKTETIPSLQYPMACDSVITYHITVSAENIQPITVRRCDDNLPYSYEYQALPAEATHTRLLTDIRETGIYDDTVSIAGQCRTIYRLNFTVDKTYDNTLPQVDVCINNLPYSWRVTDKKGNSRTISINIPDDKVLPFDTLCTANLKSIHDCDSIVRLPLRVHPTYTTQVYDTICQKSLPYTWRDNKGTSLRQIRLTDIRNSGQWKDPDWTYTTDYNHHSQYNCDSLLTLHLTVYPTLTNEVTLTLCPEQLPYQYCENGATVPVGYTGGDLTETIPSKQFPKSCDSVITYHISVSAENIVPITVTQCNNEPPYSYDYGAEPMDAVHRHRLENLKTSGVYRDTVEVAGQCRTIYELHLTVNDTTKSERTYYLCEGDTYTDIDFPTITARKDTVFVKRLEKANAVGCDSVVTVTVKFGKKYEDPTSAVVLCEREKSYLWETSDTYQATPYRHLLTWGDLHEQVLDTTLTDTLHTASPFYCDSIVRRHVTVNPTTIRDMSVTWCASAGPYSYGEKGKQASETGYYIDTLITKNHYGCDSVLHLHLEWKDSIYFHDTVRICDNKALKKHDKLYIGDKYAAFGGTYDASLYDSVRVYPVGLFRDTITFKNFIGCDSSFYIVVEVQPTHYSNQERNVCQFADVTYEAMHNGLGGSVPTDVLGDVEFMDTIPALGNGCDSVVHMTYHIRPHYHFSQGEIALCQSPGSTWIWYNEHGDPEGSISLSEGDKTYHLGNEYSTIYGCDSTYGITVYVAPIYHFYDTIPLCENDSAHWHKMLFTGSQYTAYGKTYDPTPFDSIKTNLSHGTYHVDIKHQTKVYGCDSIYHLTLYVHEVAHTDSLDSVCQGHPFHNPNWNRGEGMYMNTDRVGTYVSVDTIPSKVTGCDSIVTLTLRVDSVYDYRPYFEFCQDTIHTDTIVEWRDEAGKPHIFTLDLSKAGTFSFTDAYTSIHGCDSIFGVSWFVHPIYRFDSTYVICQSERVDWQHKGYSGDRYGWGYDRLPGDRYDTHQDVEYYHYRDGDSILTPGVYYDTAHYYSTEFGCDSTFYLKLIVQPGGHYIRNEVACGDEKYHVFYTSDAYGQHTDTIFFPPITRLLDGELKDTMYYEAERRLTAVNGGCDSIIHFHLTVHPSYEYVTSARICWGGSYEWRGGKYYSTGVYYDSIQGGTDYWHCDSVYVLELYVKPVVIIPHYDTICDNETYQHQDTLWYTNGTQSYVETMVWTPGMQIPQDYSEVYFKGRDGCDSIIYRYWLQINKTYLFDETAKLCSNETYKMEDGHLFSGLETEYEIGTPVAPLDTTFIHSYQTVHGCDSVYQLHATIYPAYRHRDTITICDDGEAVWRDHTYRGSMYGNVLGDGYPAGEHIFHDTYHTHDQGCDSIYELHLMVMPTYLFEEHIKKCADEDMTWHGHNLDHLAVGTYFFHDSSYTAVYGCDSVYHLYLTVNDTTREVLPDTICYPEVYDFHGKPLTEAGYYYDTTLNEWGCHHFTHLYLEVIDPTVPTARVDSICADDDAYDLFYTYTGDYDPIAYSVKYDEEGHRNGFEDIIDHPITTPDELSWLRIPMPNIEADRTRYPRPDYYRIKLVLDNGICTNPDLCSTDTTIVLSYPSWITQQRFGDVIALYNDTYNGGYHWSHYQWYHGDKPIPGETHEYLYVPTGLVVGDQYHVRLTRDGEVQDFQTCPITIVTNPIENDFAPEKGYLSVVPTCVCNCNPYINILSRHDGTYRITTATGRLVSQGVFRADVTQVPVPVLEGIYVVQLWSNDTPEEPYRSVKILVSSKCTPEHYENIPF